MWTWDSGLLGSALVFQGFLYVPALYNTSDLLHMRRGWLKLLLILVNVRVFRVILCGTIMHLSNFFSPHRFVNGTKGLLRGILAWKVGQIVPCCLSGFFFKLMGTCSGSALVRPWSRFVSPLSLLILSPLTNLFCLGVSGTAGYLLCLATLLGPLGPIHLRRIFSTALSFVWDHLHTGLTWLIIGCWS